MRERVRTIERGQSITFRVPSDTPDYLLKQLQQLRETERRNFSSEIAQFVLKGVNETYARKRETVTIPLPKALTLEQKNWLKHEHSEALLGTIVYQLLQDPVRAMTLLASLTSGASTVDEALYLQESSQLNEELVESQATEKKEPVATEVPEEEPEDQGSTVDDVDLSDLLDDLHGDKNAEKDEEEDEDPLEDFFSSMNR